MVELKVMLDSIKLDNMIFYAKIQIRPFLDRIKNIIDYFFYEQCYFLYHRFQYQYDGINIPSFDK
jgi:hypothetical protein